MSSDLKPDLQTNSDADGSDRSEAIAPTSGKPPRLVRQATDSSHPAIFAFPPNRETLGGTAYLIVGETNVVEETNVLVDCPAWNPTNQTFLAAQGGVDWLVLTHRGAIGKAKAFQQAFNCKILIQEQEAYLLPGLAVTAFQQEFALSDSIRAIWTAGHSPGSSCLYYRGMGGVLFSGRHLLPTPQGAIAPIKTAKTFHWPRQLRNVQALIDQFTPETLQAICPGANLGFLRGKVAIEPAYAQLLRIDLGCDRAS